MSYLPWVIAVALGLVALYVVLRPKESTTPGAGKVDARGSVDPNRAPPPDVGDDELARAISRTVQNVFDTAAGWFKYGSSSAKN